MTTETTIVTLKDACAEYLEHLKEIGKKQSTIGTAKRTLDLLIADMGEEKEVGKIMAVHVSNFFKSEAATMQNGKSGMRPRAKASILQIRRIVRDALVWWHERGYSKSVALPKEEKRFLETKEEKGKAKSKAKESASAGSDSESEDANGEQASPAESDESEADSPAESNDDDQPEVEAEA